MPQWDSCLIFKKPNFPNSLLRNNSITKCRRHPAPQLATSCRAVRTCFVRVCIHLRGEFYKHVKILK
ncbi:jg5546 [Pararge aegeria aegeria]|uniref:Jg5546 protein n=1 Tax=Pararge aegeria aegeria TaxID=348720 RepID=A0A8S4QYQ6_9NEOP|nr:jg5546 [Pararge aegeria aegeria]